MIHFTHLDFQKRHMCSFVKAVSPIDVFGRKDADEPLQIHSLEWDQHQVSGVVVHVHGSSRGI